MTTFTVGITGGSGSGKSLFIQKLASFFKEGEVTLLPQDHYYRPQDLQKIDDKGVINFDLPEAIDQEHFVQDIRLLKSGRMVEKKEYTFNNPAAKAKIMVIKPAPILIVEGLFIFSSPLIEKELDLKIFIEAKDHVKLSRRIIRDNEERGYDLNDVLYRYENHVMPVYESFIKPSKDHADLIIPNNRSFDGALKILAEALQHKLTSTAHK